jgi:hypothetical protein
MSVKIVFEKLKTKRDIAFLLVFLLAQVAFFIIAFYEGISPDNLNQLFSIYGRFFYILILVTFSSEKTSGFLAKQFSNGLSRKKSFIYHQVQLLILTTIYFLLSILSFYCISVFVVEDLTGFSRFFITFFSFTTLAQLAYLSILFFKKTVYAVIIPYIIFLGVDNGALAFLMRYSHDDFIYFLPHGLSLSLPKFYNQDIFSIVITSLLIFNALIPVLSYFKLKRTNFND